MSRHDLDVIDADTKEWIDARTSWLVAEFGRRRFLECSVVTPTEQFFPDTFAETEQGARQMLNLICGYMQVAPERVELSLYANDNQVVGAAPVGFFQAYDERCLISVEASQLGNPLALAATIAHELGHVHLLGDGRISPDADDHEPLTDLLTVFMGLGVITANNAMSDSNWQGVGMEGWSISRQGYFTMPMFGYALALFAELRDEEWPDWSKHLRLDVRHAFKRSLKYLQRHGMPQLHTVRTTAARPRLAAAASIAESDEQQAWSADESDDDSCDYCGGPLADSDPGGEICRRCQDSIDDNQAELDSEWREAAEVGSRFFKAVVRVVLPIVLGLIALWTLWR